MLLDSRAEPWPAAERAAHRLRRSAGITGWIAHHPIRLRSGELVVTYDLDICFRGRRIALEIDGRRHHDTAGESRATGIAATTS